MILAHSLSSVSQQLRMDEGKRLGILSAVVQYYTAANGCWANALCWSLHNKGTVHKRKLVKASMVRDGWWRVCVGSREFGSACLDAGQNWDCVPRKIHPVPLDLQVYWRLESCKKSSQLESPCLLSAWVTGVCGGPLERSNVSVCACISFQDKQGYVAHTAFRAERRLWFSTKRFISILFHCLSKTFVILFWKDCNKT